jgi:DNA-binding MarR family transcriptional regulator
MTKKECFINEMKAIMIESPESVLSPDALDFWNGLNASGDSDKPKFTENGKLVLRYMQENKDNYNNLFKAKDIGEGLGISSRTASGAMRKLVTDGFAEKIGESPVVYALTTSGIEINVDAE